MERFKISRPDGRSNQQVIIDATRDAEPGTIYTYAQLSAVLSDGTDTVFTTERTRNVVLTAQRRMLAEHQRTMINLRGVGYKLAFANEHSMVALMRHRKADVQLEKGLHVLRNVRWNELGENERQAHLGTLMVTEALYRNQKAIVERQTRFENALERVVSRLDKISPEE